MRGRRKGRQSIGRGLKKPLPWTVEVFWVRRVKSPEEMLRKGKRDFGKRGPSPIRRRGGEGGNVEEKLRRGRGFGQSGGDWRKRHFSIGAS